MRRPTTKHCEFAAVSKPADKKYWVEALPEVGIAALRRRIAF